MLITLYVWAIIERHPRTDDATARANVVGIVPRVSGQILKLTVQDNQVVKEGDVLFEIDPDDYKLALEKAKAGIGQDRDQTRSQQAPMTPCARRRPAPARPWLLRPPRTVDKARTSGRGWPLDKLSAKVRWRPSTLEQLHRLLLQGHRAFFRVA